MSTDEHDQKAAPEGIHDTGDLTRIWDALEQIAAKVDGAVPATETGDEEPPPTDH